MRTRKQEKTIAERNSCKQDKVENTCFDDLYEQLTRNPALEAVKHLQKLAQGDPSAVGFRTGFAFDEIILGLHPGDLLVLAARPSVGKTSLMVNIATNIALGNARTPVGIFSFEMSTRAVIIRMLSSLTQISITDFWKKQVSGEQWCKVLEASNRIQDAQIAIDDTGEMDISELRAKARLMHRQYGVKAIFIDYLQLIRGFSMELCQSRMRDCCDFKFAQGYGQRINHPSYCFGSVVSASGLPSKTESFQHPRIRGSRASC